jgi:hypothetical protein
MAITFDATKIFSIFKQLQTGIRKEG